MGIIVPTNGKPIDPKHRAWGWAGIGSLVATPLLGGPIGAYLGYQSATRQRDEELRSGMKEVPEPTYINGGLGKGIVLGGLIGGAIIGLTGGLGVLVGAAVALVWPIKTAIDRKNEMKIDYQEAITQQQSMQRSGRSQSQEQGVSRGVSQQVSKSQNYQFDNSKMANQRGDRKWADDKATKPDVASAKGIA